MLSEQKRSAETEQIVKVLVRHRFHETDGAGRGFCGGPACGSRIVTVSEHALHVAEMLTFSGRRP